MPNFPEGNPVRLKNTIVRIEEFIGKGTQGEVYKVFNYKTGEYLALKYLFGDYASENVKEIFYKRTKFLSEHKSPHKSFAWPIDVNFFDYKAECFLYTMPLKIGYAPTTNLINDPDLESTETRVKIILKTLEPLIELEDSNLIYIDVSDKNFLYKKNSVGEVDVAIIDCENITSPSLMLGLQGSGFYRAPEVFLGEKPTNSSIVHSLSVWIYRLLLGGTHPFNGKREKGVLISQEKVIEFYGQNPEFVFSNYESNAPYPSAEDAWKKLPELMRRYFEYTFSEEVLKGKAPRKTVRFLYELVKKAYNL